MPEQFLHFFLMYSACPNITSNVIYHFFLGHPLSPHYSTVPPLGTPDIMVYKEGHSLCGSNAFCRCRTTTIGHDTHSGDMMVSPPVAMFLCSNENRTREGLSATATVPSRKDVYPHQWAFNCHVHDDKLN